MRKDGEAMEEAGKPVPKYITANELMAMGGDPMKLGTVAYYNELSYRRGVHQALWYAGDIVRKRGHSEAADMLDRLCDMAGEMRYDNKPHLFLLCELEKLFNQQ